jgi:hypothetical protein
MEALEIGHPEHAFCWWITTDGHVFAILSVRSAILQLGREKPGDVAFADQLTGCA